MPENLVSIIIPVYNVENYLRECVESVLCQDLDENIEIEVLLIDDGSSDKSGIICDEFAAEDARVRVFHNENMGVSNSRNFGIEHSNGKYIQFVDSDDAVRGAIPQNC